jgi:hypothetical protein
MKYKTVGFSAQERNEISNILNDSRGWKGRGYRFTEIKTGNPDAIITLVSQKELNKKYHGTDLEGFSVTVHTPNQPKMVYINGKNWYNVPKGFVGSLTTYRAYLIQHEMGHVLGYHDEKPTDGMCSVMYQQTRGTKDICIANPWQDRQK